MNLFMNVSVETCRDLLFIIEIQTASELHMDSSLRQVHLFASLQLLVIVSLPLLSRFFSIIFVGLTLFFPPLHKIMLYMNQFHILYLLPTGTLEMESKNHTVTNSVSGI